MLNVSYGEICSNEIGCTWEESKRVCEKEGGYLVTITSKAENDKIIDIINQIDPNGDKFFFHLGLNDIENEGVYRWTSDNSQIDFDNFYDGKQQIEGKLRKSTLANIYCCICIAYDNKLLFHFP